MKKDKPPEAKTTSIRNYLWLIIAVAAIARILYISDIKPLPFFTTPVGDEAAYHKAAQVILGGDLLAGSRVFYQDPLYPYYLAAVYAVFGEHVIIPKAIQLIVGIGSCLLIFLITRMLFGIEAAVLAGFMSSLYPLFYFFEAQLLKSSLVVFFSLTLFYSLLKYRENGRHPHVLFAGLSAGLAVASQGHSYFYIPFILWWLFTLRPGAMPLYSLKEKMRVLGIFAAGMGIIILPITLRNYIVGKNVVLVTYQGGTNFYIGNNARASGIYQPLREGRELPPFEEIDAVELAEKESGRTLLPSEVSRFWFGKGCAFIISDPARYAVLLGKKTFLFFNKLEISDVVDYYFIKDRSFLFNIPFLNMGFIFPLAMIGVIAAWREKKADVVLLLYFALASFLSLVLFYVFTRYRLQGVPFFIILAASGLVYLKKLFQGRRYNTLLILAPVLVLFLSFSNMKNTVISQGLGYGLMGNMCMEKGDYKQAIYYFSEALKKRPGDYVVQRNLHAQTAKCLFELRDYDRALIEYMRVLEIEKLKKTPPDKELMKSVQMSLGLIYRLKGDYYKALEIFEDLHGEHPEDLAVRTNLSTVYKKLNRPEDALRQLAYVVERDTMNLVALNNIANLYRDAGNYAVADDFYRQCLAIDPSNTVVRKNINRMKQMQGGEGGNAEE